MTRWIFDGRSHIHEQTASTLPDHGDRQHAAAGGYEAILSHIQRIKVEQLLLEFSIPAAGDVTVLRELPENVRIGLSCVDVRFPEIDTPEHKLSNESKRHSNTSRPSESRSTQTAASRLARIMTSRWRRPTLNSKRKPWPRNACVSYIGLRGKVSRASSGDQP